jgi:hypothetical protein
MAVPWSNKTWSAPAQSSKPSGGGPSLGAVAGAAGAGPYSSGPGIQPGQKQTQMEGQDFSKLGPGERNWQNNQGVYNAPSFGEVNTQGLVGHYSNPANQPQVTNNSQNWFTQYQGTMPNIASDPGLAPYFDNAKDRAAESINLAAASRGNYGSSAAIDQNARAFTDLEGQRALKEADYNLQRLGEQRAWQSLGGQLAGSADASSRGASQDQQQWAQLLSSLGIDASRLGLDRTNAGQDAANSAQGFQRQRGQDFFSNQMAVGDRLADLMKSVYLPALDNDQEMMEVANSGGVAEGNQRLANETANAKTASDSLQTAFSIYNGLQQ